jgi:DHA1 family bicyclomycin/chloramphenicol resistance-like MFS transporter
MATTRTSAVGESRGSRVRYFIILGALTALGPLSIDAYLPGLPQLTADLNTTALSTQLSITSCLVGLGVGQLIGGPVSDAVGRRKPLLIGLGLYFVTSLLCAVVTSIWMMIALRLLQGIGGAIGIVIANAVVRDRHSGDAAAKFFSLLLLIAGLAPVFAPILGGQLLRFTTWPGIFIALAALAAVMVTAVAFALPETLPTERRQGGGLRVIGPTFARLLSDRAFFGYMMACGFSFSAMFTYIAGSSFVLQEIHGFSPQGYSIVFGVNALGLVVAAQVSGRIVHRVGPRALLGVGVAGSAFGGLAVLLSVLTGDRLILLLTGMFVVVASVGLVMPNSMALALQNNGEIAGSAAALMGLAMYFTGALSAPLAGLAGSSNALPMAVTIAVLGAVAAVSYSYTQAGRVRRRQRQQADVS